jgi:copper transport protein
VDVNCETARESLSAWIDGHEAAAQPLEVSRHLASCAECTEYGRRLGGLSELVATLQDALPPAPPYPDSAVASGSTAQPSAQTRWLCLGIVALSLFELGASFTEMLAEHGYGGEDHAGHESMSFTLAVCAGLLWIAWRPVYARSYLLLMGVAAGLLGLTASLDVVQGRAHLLDELPHLGFLLAFALLWLLSHQPGRPPRLMPWPRLRSSAPARHLRVIRGSLRAAAVMLVPFVVLVAGPSWGHATLESSNPGTGAVVARLPATVTLRFDEAVTTLPTSLQVYGPDGTRIDNGDVTHPDGDGARVSVGTSGTERGTYLVSWRVVSADSHPVSGAFTFSVGKRSAAPTAPSEQTDPTVAALLAGARWLGYAGIAVAIGGVAFLVVCWPEGWSTPRSLRLVRGGLAAIAAGAAFSLLLKGPYDAALGLSALTDTTLAHEVVSSTYGHAQLARLVLVAITLLLLAAGRGRPSRLRLGLLVVAGLGLLATYASSGHAISNHPATLAVPIDMVHMAAMSLWLGGLLMLAVLVLRDPAHTGVAGGVAARFSVVALTSVALLVASGTYQAWRQVGAWAALPATTYGRELLVKLALVAAVLVVAAASRRWVRSHSTDLAVLRRRTSVEAIGLAAVLGVTSALVATDPARSAYHPSVSANLQLGPDLVQVSAIPVGDRRMQLHLYVFDHRDRPVEPKEVSASVSLKEENIGPLALSLSKAGRGHRIADVAVPVAGEWTLDVDVRTSAIDEYSKTVTLPIR